MTHMSITCLCLGIVSQCLLLAVGSEVPDKLRERGHVGIGWGVERIYRNYSLILLEPGVHARHIRVSVLDSGACAPKAHLARTERPRNSNNRPVPVYTSGAQEEMNISSA